MSHDPVMNCLIALVLNTDGLRDAFEKASTSTDRKKVLLTFDPHLERAPKDLVDAIVERQPGNLLDQFGRGGSTQHSVATAKELSRALSDFQSNEKRSKGHRRGKGDGSR